MPFTSLIRPLMVGVLHSFEPDHVTAVSVLASENAVTGKKVDIKSIFKASQWALGHSVTLLIFGGVALMFKELSSLVIDDISLRAEMTVGPIMVWLGILAIRRNFTIKENKDSVKHEHNFSNPMNKSFWVGMLHGLAGTGGVLTSALVLSSSSISEAVTILAVESLGITVTMGVYSYLLLSLMNKFIKSNLSIFKWMNGIAGLASIAVGSLLIFNSWLS